MLKVLLRPIIITMMFVMGGAFPVLNVLEPCISWSLVVMLYFIALSLKFSDIHFYKEHFQLLGLNFLLGLTPWAILLLTPFDLVAKAAFFAAIAPTANAAPVIVSFLRGKVPFTVSAFVITNFFITLSLVGLLPIVTGETNFSFVITVIKNLAFVVGLPIVLATLTRLIFKHANTWSAKCKDVSFSAWALALLAIAAKASHFLQTQANLDMIQVVFIASVVAIICFLNFYIGSKVGRVEFRQEMSQALGQKNTNFCIFLALTCGGAGEANAIIALGPTFYVLYHNMWNAFQIFMLNHADHMAAKKTLKKDQEVLV